MNKLIQVSFFLLAFSFIGAATPPAEEGKAIFSTRCASCHNLTKNLTGPALAGVHERRSIDWIISFVRSSQTMIKAGDKDANEIFTKFNKIPMPDHADLTADNIKSIVEYIKSAPTVEKPPFAKPAKLRPAYMPLSLAKDGGFFIAYLGIVVFLIFAMVAWVYVKELARKKCLLSLGSMCTKYTLEEFGNCSF